MCCGRQGPDLLSLQLSDNQLSGTLPDAFMYAQQLRDFGAASNQLTGPIPASLPYTPGLRQLTLAHNQLTGSITPWIGALSNLRVVDLRDNELTGVLPSSLGWSPTLEVSTARAPIWPVACKGKKNMHRDRYPQCPRFAHPTELPLPTC